MTQKKFMPGWIVAAIAIAAVLFGCSKGTDRPVSSWISETDNLTGAIEDTVSNGTMLFHDGLSGVGIGSIVNLTADQKQQIKAILEKYHPLQVHDFKGKRPSREEWKARRDSMKTMRDSIRNKIVSVLTPDQKALIDQIKTQLKAGEVPDTLVTLRVQRLTSLLTLSPNQQSMAFTILRQEIQKRLDARIKDSTFVRDSSRLRGMRWQKQAGMKPFGILDTLEKILTDQQKQILEQEKQRIEKRFKKMRE
jgi:Spy/CpxP family protein refolding chaperone